MNPRQTLALIYHLEAQPNATLYLRIQCNYPGSEISHFHQKRADQEDHKSKSRTTGPLDTWVRLAQLSHQVN